MSRRLRRRNGVIGFYKDSRKRTRPISASSPPRASLPGATLDSYFEKAAVRAAPAAALDSHKHAGARYAMKYYSMQDPHTFTKKELLQALSNYKIRTVGRKWAQASRGAEYYDKEALLQLFEGAKPLTSNDREKITLGLVDMDPPGTIIPPSVPNEAQRFFDFENDIRRLGFSRSAMEMGKDSTGKPEITGFIFKDHYGHQISIKKDREENWRTESYYMHSGKEEELYNGKDPKQAFDLAMARAQYEKAGVNAAENRLKVNGPPNTWQGIVDLNSKEKTSIIRSELKKDAPSLSVRMASGTSYGWIYINGSGPSGAFTEKEKAVLAKYGLDPHNSNIEMIPSDKTRSFVAKILGVREPTDEEKAAKYRRETEEFKRKSMILKPGVEDQGKDLGSLKVGNESIRLRLRDEQHIVRDPGAFRELRSERVNVEAPPRTLFEAVQNPTNWKDPPRPIKLATLTEAQAMAKAESHFLGGSEIHDTGEGFVVMSKGYYHYVGA